MSLTFCSYFLNLCFTITVNIHPSLLSLYCGDAPVQRALEVLFSSIVNMLAYFQSKGQKTNFLIASRSIYSSFLLINVCIFLLLDVRFCFTRFLLFLINWQKQRHYLRMTLRLQWLLMYFVLHSQGNFLA
jgi:hypothetical protein